MIKDVPIYNSKTIILLQYIQSRAGIHNQSITTMIRNAGRQTAANDLIYFTLTPPITLRL